MRLAAATTFGALLLLLACDDDTSLKPGGAAGSDGGTAMTDGPAGRTGSPAAMVDCAQVASTYCGTIDRCAGLYLKVGYGDVATCEARLRIACADQLAAPGTGYTPASVGACLTAVRAASCADLLDHHVTGCALAGMRADGQACGGDAQCTSSHCKQDDVCGQCAPLPAAGEACTENDDCALGMVCAGPDGKKRCATPAAVGAACSASVPCTLGNFCKQGVCAKVAGPGEPCSGEGSCDGLQALYCDEGAKTCRKAVLVAPGEPCGIVNGGYAICTGGGACAGLNPNLLQLTGVCAAPAKDGEACGAAANGRPCLPPARCSAGACKLPASASCQ
jgi:hypothetical protein